MKPILERINEGEVLAADGAMGSMLMAMWSWEYCIITTRDNLNQSLPEHIKAFRKMVDSR